MALSTRRLCVLLLLLLLLGLAATFGHGNGAVLLDDHEIAATFPGRRAGLPVAGAYHGSGFSHVPPHSFYGSKQISFGVSDYSAGGRGSVWNVGAVVVAPVLAAAWFA